MNLPGGHPPFRLRDLEPGDGPRIAALLAAGPDTGMVRLRAEYRIDPYRALTFGGHDSGVVVESDDLEGLAGLGMVHLGEEMVCGERRPFGYLHTLVVHPACRRRGMARAIAERRVAMATESLGSDAVIIATIQQGNVGSFANARSWATQMSRPMLTMVVPMPKSPPAGASAGRVRPARPEDLAEFAVRYNVFHEDFDLWSPAGEEGLARWLAASPVAETINGLWVVEDAAGNLQAGMGVTDTRPITTTHVDSMPAVMRALNLLVRLVPSSGTVDALTVSRPWFQTGRESAARTLFETVRWELRSRGDAVSCTFDPLGTAARMIPRPRLQMTSKLSLAVRTPATLRPERFIAPVSSN
jgi:GNAT superfamily N-acetyltransferase